MSQEPARAYLGLGGNVGEVEITMMEALHAIDSLPQTSVRAQSALYRSPAWGRTDQPDFINAAAELRTSLVPRVLLDYLLGIETRFGRVRGQQEKWGPRTLDLDLLLFGDQVLEEDGLRVPHPHMHERAFVLLPLAEIAPRLQVPGRGPIANLLASLDCSGIEAIP